MAETNQKPENMWTCGSLSVKVKVHQPDGRWNEISYSTRMVRRQSNFPHAHCLSLRVSHSLLHHFSLLTKATEPTHGGVAHCGLYKTCQLGNSIALLIETLLQSGRASAASQAEGWQTVSERPWQQPPELETDCLAVWECTVNLIHYTIRMSKM